MQRHIISKPFWCNCFFTIMLLFLRGKVNRIYYVKGGHFIGRTKRGNYLHFKTTYKYERCTPYFFQGYYEVVSHKAKRSHWKNIFYFLENE